MDAQEIVEENDSQAPPTDPVSPDPDSMTQDLQGDGLTVREAAQVSGMTEKMIRVRIRNGTIDSWKVQGKFGPEWRVRLPEGEDAAAPPETHTDDGTEETDGVPVAPAPAAPAPSARERPAPTGSPSAPMPSPAAGVTVPVDLFHGLLVRHEEISIRLGRAEALLETASTSTTVPAESPSAPSPPEPIPASAPQAAPAPEQEHTAPPGEAREHREAPPSQSLERLQRIARDEAEARYRAEVEVARLRQALQAAERTIEDLRGLLKSLGMAP